MAFNNAYALDFRFDRDSPAAIETREQARIAQAIKETATPMSPLLLVIAAIAVVVLVVRR